MNPPKLEDIILAKLSGLDLDDEWALGKMVEDLEKNHPTIRLPSKEPMPREPLSREPPSREPPSREPR